MFKSTKDGALYIRNVIFGIADSLVSTVGLLAGIDVSGADHRAIVFTGVIYGFVEAFSMAVGSFLSEESTEEYETKHDVPVTKPLIGGTIMFISFVIASFIPLAPYIFFQTSLAPILSISLSIAALFVVGLISARFSKVNTWSRAIKMALLGGAAIVIGVIVGKVVR